MVRTGNMILPSPTQRLADAARVIKVTVTCHATEDFALLGFFLIFLSKKEC